MTDLVKSQLELLKKREYRNLRKPGGIVISERLPKHEDGTNYEIFTALFKTTLENEDILLFPNDWFGFHRSQERSARYFLENGEEFCQYGGGNITPNYLTAISRGFDSLAEELRLRLQTASAESTRFYNTQLNLLSIVLAHCDKVRKEALRQGCTKLAQALHTVPRKPATSFYEACLFQYILIYMIRTCYTPHLTLGRFDQYMFSYYLADLKAGITQEELMETLEMYFIQLNIDTDLYPGIQLGDNGQSMVLGGFDKDGNSMFQELSHMCMEASIELNLIDPKINLRCGKNTPQELFELGTRMTKQGLGFPQYCNDDIVVPGLIALGYAPEDAINYSVAACWEYIVPNCAADVPNVGVFNFPLVINRAVHAALCSCPTFEDLMEAVRKEIVFECDNIVTADTRHFFFAVSPLLAFLIDGCMEKGKDIFQCAAKYNNYGCHGAGISNAADALMAIKELIYDKQVVAKETLLNALNANFDGYTELQNQLRECPKMGNNDDCVDSIACDLMDTFASNLNGRPNPFGGIWRAGTGSAMEYVISAKKCPATADGRQDGKPYGSSFSPAITTKLNGPLSVIQSFTKFDLKKIINGGPLTMEIHDSVFRNEMGEKKVAQLVRAFIELGGHQLQLNSINRETLLDAQKHPEKYPNLIVRVWGWSGYFFELDRAYQDHIIKRTEFSV